MWPNSLCIDVILLCLYDALDGRDTLSYFLSSIILDAKNKENVGNNQEFFYVYIQKFQAEAFGY